MARPAVTFFSFALTGSLLILSQNQAIPLARNISA